MDGSSSLSVDLRARLLTAIDGGLSCRAAAPRLGAALIDSNPLAGTATQDGLLRCQA
jgi:hypothetical protein